MSTPPLFISRSHSLRRARRRVDAQHAGRARRHAVDAAVGAEHAALPLVTARVLVADEPRRDGRHDMCAFLLPTALSCLSDVGLWCRDRSSGRVSVGSAWGEPCNRHVCNGCNDISRDASAPLRTPIAGRAHTLPRLVRTPRPCVPTQTTCSCSPPPSPRAPGRRPSAASRCKSP